MKYTCCLKDINKMLYNVEIYAIIICTFYSRTQHWISSSTLLYPRLNSLAEKC